MRTIIIDDQIRSRRVLKRMLTQYCSGIDIIAEADSIDTGLETINTHHPELVFLDVELGDGTGFDLLGQLPTPPAFKIIFVTAYDSYAIKAIKWSALDYILKPVDPEELVAAVNKIAQSSKNNLEAKESIQIKGDKLGVPTMEGLLFVAIQDITRCEAKGAYTEFHFVDNTKIIVSKSIQSYDSILQNHNFFRIHKSHLVNLNYIKEYIKGRGGNVVMADGTTIAVALRKKEEFLQHILH